MAHLLPCGHEVNLPEQTHYCSYLRIEELLRLQPGREDVRHPDEHLFVVTHQAHELWFSQLIWDLRRLIGALEADDVGLATWLAQRCASIGRLFGPMMRLLETMAPSDFYAFRAHLAPASGGESAQWHEVELLAGARDAAFRRMLEAEVSGDATQGTQARLWTDRLAELWEGPSVAGALGDLLQRRGLAAADLYRVAPEANPAADLMLLAEALLDFDEEVRTWRYVHARTAERAIGPDVEGTGHTTGVQYLDRAAMHRAPFFPALWEARRVMWERAMSGKAG